MTHPRLEKIKVCAFDAYGTLFNVHSAVARGGQALGDKAQAVSETWRLKQLQYTWLRSLMKNHADFWQVTSDGLAFALESHGVDDPELHKSLMNLYMTLDAYDDVIPCLQGLKARGLQTAILSNGNRAMLDAATNSAGLNDVLDASLSIDDVGIYKPDPSVYQMVGDRFGVAADEICFMSTNAWDASAAADFGFNVVWLNRFGQIPENLPGELVTQITSLDELAGLL
ncbi:haloacid dehalogenase type II [Alphaproteobacteria bacterium]|nr:haloacid dehalogenase type II [Alphaproteobacteria bacterium]